MSLRILRNPGSPTRALILSGIAVFGLVAAAHAHEGEHATSQSGAVSGAASVNGSLQDESQIEAESEYQDYEMEEETSLPGEMDMADDTSISDPSIQTDPMTTEREEESMMGDDQQSLAPSDSYQSPSLDSQPQGSMTGSEYEMEESAKMTPSGSANLQSQRTEFETEKMSTSQSAATAPVESSVGPGNQSEEVFPEMRKATGGTQIKPTLGFMAGYQNVKGEVNSAIGFGVDAGFNILAPVSVGVQIQYSPSDVDVGNLNANFDTTNYLARAYYHFGGDINVVKHTYVGWKAGVARYSGAFETNTNLAIGPAIGMDFPVDRAKKFTVGPQASYLSVLDADDQFSLVGAARYWF